MKKNVAWVRTCLVFLLTLTVLCACSNAEVKAVRAMPVNHVDLTKVKDGNYRGDFSYGGFTYEVQVTVVSHQVKEIAIIKNRTSQACANGRRYRKEHFGPTEKRRRRGFRRNDNE